MNILCLVAMNTEMLIDRLIVGLVRKGFRLRRNGNLFVCPLKPNLFEKSSTFNSYGLPYPAMSDLSIKQHLDNNFFDVVFISNIWQWRHWRGVYKYLLSSIKDTPCVLISEAGYPVETVWDLWDFQTVNWVAKFYKSKMYAWDGYPIAMAMLEEDLGQAEEKDIDVFFAGDSTPPIRQRYLEALQKAGFKYVYGNHVAWIYSDYLDMIRRAWISPVLPSFAPYVSRNMEVAGQHTVAFLPDIDDIVELRDGFVDGKNAVYFNREEPDDLLKKIAELLPDKDKMMKIAQAGYEHVLNHHLVEHQVDYVMGIVEPLLY